MKFKPTPIPCVRDNAVWCGGFTLSEVLAALVFMAIVIPVAVEGLRVASQAGEVGRRKAAAGRIAERVLSEWLVTSQSPSVSQNGMTQEGAQQYRWTLKTQNWTADTASPMNQVMVDVFFPVQGRQYDVRLTTLVSNSLQ